MKKFLLVALILIIGNTLYAQQSGPAGLGTTDGSSPLEIWLRADQGISTINNKVQTWADLSGNGRNMTQTTAGRRPSFISASPDLNAKPTVDFVASSNTYLNGALTQDFFGVSGEPTEIGDVFVVFKQPATNSGYVVQFPNTTGNSSFLTLLSNGGDSAPADNNVLNDVQLFVRQSDASFSVLSTHNDATYNDHFVVDQFHLARFGIDPTTEDFWLYDNSELLKQATTANQISYNGGTGDEVLRLGGSGSGSYYDGEIAEFFVFSEKLNNAQFVIIQNYLNSRYGISTSNDLYAGDLDINSNHDLGVFGIGQASGSEVISSATYEGLTIEATAGLEDNDYLFAGHKILTNTILDTDIAGLAGASPARVERAWYFDITDANTSLTTTITFDLDDAGLEDVTLANASNYKLISRSTPNNGSWSDAGGTVTINDLENTISFSGITVTDGNYYTVATTDNNNSPLGHTRQTWYSFQTGPWGDPNSWTLDGATTPLFDNNGNEIPGLGDKVIITSGRVISMYEADGSTILDNISVESVALKPSGRLDLLASTGHNFGAISGSGTLTLTGIPNTGTPTAYIENLPDGDYSAFADQLLGGTITLNTATNNIPLVLNQTLSGGISPDPNGAVSRSMTVNMGDADDIVILQRSLYLTRNLNITQGVLQIHRNTTDSHTGITFTDSNLNIDVVNNITIAANGSITTGNVNQRHQLNSYGNVSINGSTKFTQRTSATLTSTATDGIVDLNFLNTEADQSLTCNAVAHFYRIEIDKQSASHTLSITASADGNFNLNGRANYTVDSDLNFRGTNNNAFALVTGTAKIGSNVSILLNQGGNYSISSSAMLWVDGGHVLKTNGSALVPYGTFKISDGVAEFLVQSGITIRDAGAIEVTGGSLYANQIRTSIQATDDIGSYLQSGGHVYVNGGSGIGSSTTGGGGTQTDYYTFCLPEEANVFRMSGGTLEIQRSNYNTTSSTGTPNDEDATDDLGGGIFINSAKQNIEVTGGTVIMNMNNTVPFKVTSKAPFYNVIMTNSQGNAINDADGSTTVNIKTTDDNIVFLAGGQSGDGSGSDVIMQAQPLVVLNDLTIGDDTNPIRFDHLGQDVTIGRNFTITHNAQYYFGNEDLLPSTGTSGLNTAENTIIPASHQNTTTFNGTLNSTLSLANLDVLTDNRPSGYNEAENNEQVFFNMTISKENNTTLTLTAPNKPVSTVSNIHNALRTGDNSNFRLESGILNQGNRSIRFYGNVYNASQLSVYEEGVTDINALLKFRPATFTIETEPGAKFGNFRLNCQDQIISIDNDVTIERLEYLHGRLYIGKNRLTVDELDVNLTGNADYGNCNGCFSVEDMIITDGNASDGGLSLKISATNNTTINGDTNFDGNSTIQSIPETDFLFPVGIGGGVPKYTPSLLSISDVGDLGEDGEGYIIVNPVQGALKTTKQTGEILNYHWRVRTEGFDAEPELSYIQFFGNNADDPSSGVNLLSYVAGKVLDGSDFARSFEPTNTVTTPSPPFENVDYSILFNGSGSGFTLENTNFTAGDQARFEGYPRKIYARKNGQWHDPTTWSENGNGSPALTLVSELPQLGDIVILGSNDGAANRLVAIDPNNANYAPIDIARLVILRYHTGESSLLTFGDSEVQRDLHDFGFVTNQDPDIADPINTINHSSKLKFAGPGLPKGDFGEFVSAPNTLWTYSRQFPGTTVNISNMAGGNVATVNFDGYTIDNSIDEYPTLQFDASGSTIAGTNRYITLPDIDITVNQDIRHFIGSNRVKFNTSATGGDVHVKGNLVFNSGTNQLEFQATGTSRTLTVDGDINFNNNAASNRLLVEDAASSLTHNVVLSGSIINNNNSSRVTLYHSATNTKANLTVAGMSDESLPDFNTNIALNKLIVNKGEDQTNSFTVQDVITFPDINVSDESPIELLNGRLIIDHAGIDLLLANAGTGDFNLPNLLNSEASSGSAGLEIQQGTLRIEGDDTGIILDGSLVLNGGNLDMSSGVGNGNNFIEYSATGNAVIEVTNASSILSVGSQIRRGFFSEAGVLDLNITDGSLLIGVSSKGDYRRGMLEVVNPGSNITFTGGLIVFTNQNGVNATEAIKASLLLEPDTYDLTGSTIYVDLIENTNNNFSINSAIPLYNLTVQSDFGSESEVVQLKTRSLTIEGDLTLSNDVELRSNNLGLTLQGDLVINDDAVYSAGINKTTFNIGAGETSILTGTNTSAVSFYNFEKTGEGTLDLNKDISITGATFKLSQGTLSDNDNAIHFLGQTMSNDGVHTSGSNLTNGGIIFERTNDAQVLSTSAEGIFGNLTINNVNGVALPDANQDFQITNNLTLNAGVFDIGPALLLITSTGTITNGTGNGSSLNNFGEANQIQTNSSIIDFGLEKEFAANNTANFVFPVGEGNRYTPVLVDFTSPGGNSGSTIGKLRIRPRNAVAPIMLSEDQTVQDAILQYHWLINGDNLTNFSADIIGSYDDDVIGTDDENTYRGARAIFSDPDLTVENPFPSNDADLVDDVENTITFPIASESDFSGEYFAGNPDIIPDNFETLIFDGLTNTNYDIANNYFFDENDNGVFDGIDVRQTDLSAVIGGAIEIASTKTMALNIDNISFSRLIIPADGVLEIAGTNGHILGQVSGTGTIRINSDGSTAALPAGDYLNFFDCSGGALEYGGSGDYTILVESNKVRQLTLNGSGTKTFVSNSNIEICENLIMNSGTLNLASEKTFLIGGDFNMNGGTINMATDGLFKVLGDVDLTAGIMTTSDNSYFELLGDLNRTATTISSVGGTSTVLFSGSTTQNITGDFNIANVIINNTASGTAINITGGSIFKINGSINFLDGIVATDNTNFKSGSFTINNVLEFATSASFTGGSSASFVDGVVRKENLVANSNFTFPTGDGSTYAPISIQEDGTGGETWTTRYIRVNPTTYLSNNYSNIGTTAVSTIEFWVVHASTPGQSATIGLTYGTQSNVLTPDETTVVSIFDNIGGGNGVDNIDTWSDAGRGGLSSGASTTSGVISTNPTTIGLNFFTLGGQSDTALPVELVNLEAEVVTNAVQINWSTASELNNDRFEIERSADGVTYEYIGIVEGHGTTSELQKYTFVDESPYYGVAYYRLVQVDYDGAEAIYGPAKVNNDQFHQGLELVFFPNPTDASNVNLRLVSGDENSPVQIVMFDLTGHMVYNQTIAATLGVSEHSIPTRLHSGIYQVIITQGNNKRIERLVISN
ncbi:T9SS type A sorting domain-containing protein [Reichenbachiella carrageenanivorans]|uniref:T9SS type A sorting domain-containing protein n=1 Tax=Reichenbachiella carrageenanivorans TaxID=2979869 RepID=A0ABY6CYW2_9BACT|nr:T9SS type A sorting domain-containing protein [Reichenbachiella carrageenanivorans]UXX79058.1 T9SS type A sorting domain-containing protein [Reichenbachiella carrageenanivorans]